MKTLSEDEFNLKCRECGNTEFFMAEGESHFCCQDEINGKGKRVLDGDSESDGWTTYSILRCVECDNECHTGQDTIEDGRRFLDKWAYEKPNYPDEKELNEVYKDYIKPLTKKELQIVIYHLMYRHHCNLLEEVKLESVITQEAHSNVG